MSSATGGRLRAIAAAVEVLIASLIVLLTRARRVPVRPGWRPGAVEIPVSFVPRSKRRALALANGKQQPRLFRPVMLVGFLVAFAGLGVGFGDFKVDPSSVYAPGTPEASVVVVRLDPTVVDVPASGSTELTIDEPADDPDIVAAAAAPTDTPEPPTATPEDEPTSTPEPTREPPTPTPTDEPVQAAAPTATPEPVAPAADPYPADQLSEAELHAAATAAGWPAELLPEVSAVAWCESRYRPNARSSVAYGIMQLVPNWFDYAGVDFAKWTDPVVNLQVAYAVYRYDIERGSAPWSQWLCKPSSVSLPSSGATATATTPPATPTASATTPPWPESSASPDATAASAANDEPGDGSTER